MDLYQRHSHVNTWIIKASIMMYNTKAHENVNPHKVQFIER